MISRAESYAYFPKRNGSLSKGFLARGYVSTHDALPAALVDVRFLISYFHIGDRDTVAIVIIRQSEYLFQNIRMKRS